MYCEQILNVHVQDMILQYSITFKHMIKMNNMYLNMPE